MLLLPLGFVVFKALNVPQELLTHLQETLVFEASWGSFTLLVGVLYLTAAIGLSSAYFIARYEFPLKRFFEWALLLPLAIPAYVTAFVWLSLFDYSGDFSVFMRNLFPEFSWRLGIRSQWGLILCLAFSLYPYVYLSCLEGFKKQSRSHLESSLSLGVSRWRIWSRVEMPLVLPWLLGALLLVGMETLADFGAASVFNASVFTTLVYRSWFGLQSLETASFLSAVHILFLLVFSAFFFRAANSRKIWDSSMGRDSWPVKRLSQAKGLLLSCGFSLLFFAAFLVPVLRLVQWALENPAALFEERVLERLGNSILLGGLVVIVLLGMSVLFILAKVIARSSFLERLLKTSALGYGIPGTVLAVGWMIFVTKGTLHFQGLAHLMSTVAVFALAFGLSTRFFALMQRPLDASLQQLSPSTEDSMKLLGVPWWQRFWRSYLPLSQAALVTGAIFVFVDTMKEMPMTLMMRPQGWETLSVRVHQFTSEGLWERAAAPSLWIVLASLYPVWWLKRRLK